MNVLLMIHPAVRWVIIAVAFPGIIGFTIGWPADSLFQALDRCPGS